MDKRKPDFRFEKRAWRQGYEVIIGVDEVGRGALAGPVVAGAVGLGIGSGVFFARRRSSRYPGAGSLSGEAAKNILATSLGSIGNKRSSLLPPTSINWEKLGIDDSKRLTGKKREELAKIIRAGVVWGIGEAGAATINRRGIVRATEKAMRAAVAEVLHQTGGKKVFVLVDAFHVKYVPGVGLKNQRGIVKGDQKSLSIAAASIVAKVHRDRMMTKVSKVHKVYKVYRWWENKGYGTADHVAAIKRYGVTRLHRKKFVENLL